MDLFPPTSRRLNREINLISKASLPVNEYRYQIIEARFEIFRVQLTGMQILRIIMRFKMAEKCARKCRIGNLKHGWKSAK